MYVAGGIDLVLWRELADLGIVGIGMPEADGGAGLGFAEVAIVLEEVGRTVAQIPAMAVMGMAAPFLAEYAPKHLAGLASGERIVTVAILELMVAGGLVNTLTALVLVYTAQGLPLAVFILSEFMRSVSDDLKNAGRIDGLSEYRIFFTLVLPLVRPAMATVAVFTMIPIWNDLWFPLILAPSEATKTITLGAQIFIGQFVTNWNAVLAAL